MHSLNAPCPYIRYWPEDGSLELKHVAIYVLMNINVLLFDLINLLIYCKCICRRFSKKLPCKIQWLHLSLLSCLFVRHVAFKSNVPDSLWRAVRSTGYSFFAVFFFVSCSSRHLLDSWVTSSGFVNQPVTLAITAFNIRIALFLFFISATKCTIVHLVAEINTKYRAVKCKDWPTVKFVWHCHYAVC